MSNGEALTLWVGVRCRNPNCLRDFPLMLNDEPLAALAHMGDSEEEVMAEISRMAGKMAPILNLIAALQGAGTADSGNVAINPLLHHCPYCGRHYIYLYPDYFLTTEPMPEPVEE